VAAQVYTAVAEAGDEDHQEQKQQGMTEAGPEDAAGEQG
jgi:hypothetical protein